MREAIGATRLGLRATAAMSLAVCGSVASAGEIQQTFPAPSLDRWNYIFAGFGAFPAGSEPDAPLFSPFGNPQQGLFDNRDGEMIVGFNTSPAIPSGEGVARYRVLEARVTAVVSRDLVFAYDPTPDPVGSYFVSTDPEFVADADAGRPLEMFLVGYRAPWSLATYTETTPFAPGAPGTLPSKGNKNAFSAQYEPAGSGVVRNVSNNVDERFDPRPLAVGTAALTPGALVPAGTVFTFEIDLENNPDAQRYLREGLDFGRLNFSLSSLATVTQQNSAAPAFWSKEGDPVLGAVSASLSIRVCVGKPSDFDCNGVTDLLDLLTFQSAWSGLLGSSNSGPADVSGDGRVDLLDLLQYLSAWVADLGT